MKTRARVIRKLVSTYQAAKKADPKSKQLLPLRRQIVLALPDNKKSKKEIQREFLDHLRKTIANKKSIEDAIQARMSIPNFTHLEDIDDFAKLKFDSDRVFRMLGDYLHLKKQTIRHHREAIIVEAVLCHAFREICIPFADAQIELMTAPEYAQDREIQYLDSLKINDVLTDFCIEAISSVCQKGIKMELKSPHNGYRFKENFMAALGAKASSQSLQAAHPRLMENTDASALSTPRGASSNRRGLYTYLTTMGIIFLVTGALVGLCFIPIIGPMISTGFSTTLGGLASFLGLDAALDALVTGITVFILVNFGASVSLVSAASLLAISSLGAINAAWVTLAAGITSGVAAIQGSTKLTSSTMTVLKPLLKRRSDETLLIESEALPHPNPLPQPPSALFQTSVGGRGSYVAAPELNQKKGETKALR